MCREQVYCTAEISLFFFSELRHGVNYYDLLLPIACFAGFNLFLSMSDLPDYNIGLLILLWNFFLDIVGIFAFSMHESRISF